jgi:hypothetical protein
MINLRRLEYDSGKAGAREKFERLIARLVKLRFQNAEEIRPNPGDWGIDTYVGKLTSGSISVWQAKYFPDGVDDSQKDQIRQSFEHIIQKSIEKGFKIRVWHLCIPCALSPDETIWWEKWQKERKKETRITIKLMAQLTLVTMLSTPDAEALCLEFNLKDIPQLLQVVREERPIEALPDEESRKYDHSIFVLKLYDAGITEIDMPKKEFFNAEIVSREIRDKKDNREIAELDSLYDKIYSMWYTRYIEANQSQNRNEAIKTIYPSMLRAIEEKNNELLYCQRLPVSFFHKKGFMQQMADLCTIGWTYNYKRLSKKEPT